MPRFVVILFVAISSFYLGWLANGRFSPITVKPIAVPIATLNERPANNTNAVIPTPETASVNQANHRSYSQYFRQLLAQQDFDQAMQVFDQAMDADEAQAQSLHADLMVYLHSALEQERNEALMSLVDAYLTRYYDDVDVLMVLAEYQRRQGYPDEAARVFQLAFTYAYQSAQQNKVAAAFTTLVDTTNTVYAEQQRWVELLSFYQLLNSIDLSQPKTLFNQALVYWELDDINSARELLLPLTEDRQWGGKASELLAAIDQQTKRTPDSITSVNAIPLLRHGSHYLIKVQLNAVSEVTLIIDTGATITSLSQRSFTRLSQYSNYNDVGSRLFNTANGITRGTVYRTNTFGLGDHVLRDVKVAVLDFDQEPEIDGLLGMNVLQHFRFEIDQDKQLLLLRAR